MLLGTQGLESRLASFSEEKKKKRKFWTWPKRSAAVALASLALVGAASMGGKKGIGKAKGGSIPSGGKTPKTPNGTPKTPNGTPKTVDALTSTLSDWNDTNYINDILNNKISVNY
jgi:hypothetical protein